jgi:hypothetical protein
MLVKGKTAMDGGSDSGGGWVDAAIANYPDQRFG